MNYKLQQTTIPGQPVGVIRIEDGAHIPPDPSNLDWQDYLKWVDEGGVVEPADYEG